MTSESDVNPTLLPSHAVPGPCAIRTRPPRKRLKSGRWPSKRCRVKPNRVRAERRAAFVASVPSRIGQAKVLSPAQARTIEALLDVDELADALRARTLKGGLLTRSGDLRPAARELAALATRQQELLGALLGARR